MLPRRFVCPLMPRDVPVTEPIHAAIVVASDDGIGESEIRVEVAVIARGDAGPFFEQQAGFGRFHDLTARQVVGVAIGAVTAQVVGGVTGAAVHRDQRASGQLVGRMNNLRAAVTTVVNGLRKIDQILQVFLLMQLNDNDLLHSDKILVQILY